MDELERYGLSGDDDYAIVKLFASRCGEIHKTCVSDERDREVHGPEYDYGSYGLVFDEQPEIGKPERLRHDQGEPKEKPAWC